MVYLAQVWTRTFSALAHRNFRWFWLARMATMAGHQMVLVARGWLVYQVTGSALMLGWVNSARMLTTFVVSPLGGVVADKLNKRNVMLFGRVVETVNFSVIGTLIATGRIQVWHLLVAQVVSGMIFALLVPTREALMAELIDRRVLLNAQALHSLVIALMGILASVVGGVLIATIGVGQTYYLAAVFYVGNFLSYLQLPSVPGHDTHFSPRQTLQDLLEGLRYIAQTPRIGVLLVTRLARTVLATPYQTFLPVFAADVFGMGPVGLGMLTGASRLGGVVGSLLMAYLGDIRHKGQLLLLAGIATGVTLVLFANAPLFYVALFILLLMGILGNMTTVISSTLMQTATERRVRGRVMSASTMVSGLSSIGEVPAGALADAVSAPFTVTLLGASMAAVFVALFVRRPDFRRLE